MIKSQHIGRLLLVSLLASVFCAEGRPANAAHVLAERTGTLIVAHGDPVPGGGVRPNLSVSLVDDAGVELKIDSGAVEEGPLRRLAGKRVRVSTQRRGGSEQLLKVAVASPDSSTAPVAASKTDNVLGVRGTRPFLTILCRFGDSTGEPPQDHGFYETLFTSPDFPGMDAYFQRASFGAMSLEGSRVTDWITLPGRRDEYVVGPSNDVMFARMVEDAVAIVGASVACSDFYAINLVFDRELDGRAYEAPVIVETAGIARVVPVTFIPPLPPINRGLIIHEMGHALGLPHSGGPGGVYDSRWDPMSFGPELELIAFSKDTLGWLEPSRKLYVAPGVTSTVALKAAGALAEVGGPRVVIVPIDPEAGIYYTVEARRHTGYDFALPGEGVVIHRVDLELFDGVATVVDASPDDGTAQDPDSSWQLGMRFEDQAAGVSVLVGAVTEDGFSVTVENAGGRVSACPQASPAPGRWLGQFYLNRWLLLPASAADGGNGTLHAEFDADGGSLPCGVSDVGFFARWTRDEVFADGLYRFTLPRSGVAARCAIDGRIVLDDVLPRIGGEPDMFEVALAAGVHRIEVTSDNFDFKSSVGLSWQGPIPSFGLVALTSVGPMSPGIVTIPITVEAFGGFSDQVHLFASTSAEGAAVTLSATEVSPGARVDLELRTDTAGVPDFVPITIVGNAAGIERTLRVYVRVRRSFELRTGLEPVILQAGKRGTLQVRILRDAGFAGPVTVTAPTSLNPNIKWKAKSVATSSDSVTFAFKVLKKRTSPGAETELFFVGASGDRTHVAPVRVRVLR